MSLDYCYDIMNIYNDTVTRWFWFAYCVTYPPQYQLEMRTYWESVLLDHIMAY